MTRFWVVFASAAAALLLPASGTEAIDHLMADDFIGRFRVNGALNGDTYLADPRGLTVYTHEKDPPGKSVCTAACAEAWLPVPATATDTAVMPFTVIKRDDGALQWAYQDKPLYRNGTDMQPGHTNGDGVEGAWFIVMVGAHEM